MFAAVSQNILKCIFTYLGLLFAFSLTLHFLFRTQKDFDSVGFTFLKVTTRSYYCFRQRFFFLIIMLLYFPDLRNDDRRS